MHHLKDMVADDLSDILGILSLGDGFGADDGAFDGTAATGFNGSGTGQHGGGDQDGEGAGLGLQTIVHNGNGWGT